MHLYNWAGFLTQYLDLVCHGKFYKPLVIGIFYLKKHSSKNRSTVFSPSSGAVWQIVCWCREWASVPSMARLALIWNSVVNFWLAQLCMVTLDCFWPKIFDTVYFFTIKCRSSQNQSFIYFELTNLCVV